VNRGLVALGDSITRGHGEPMLGLHFQSWALWLAEALSLPCTNLAVDGAVARSVLAEQVPRLDGPYALGCLYVGVNDARDPAWDPGHYERDLRAVLAALSAVAERVLVCTLPEDLGRPTAAPKPVAANRIVRAASADAGAAVVALDDLGGPLLVLPDRVHLTALGEVEVARRALAACGPPSVSAALPSPDLSRASIVRWRLRRARLDRQDRRRAARERRAAR
jgi:hypothetical protein